MPEMLAAIGAGPFHGVSGPRAIDGVFAMGVRQLIANFNASFETFVNKIENHEAVADQVIADAAAATSRIRAEERRNMGYRDRLSTELAKARTEAAQWERRAVSLPEGNDKDALECVARAEYDNARAAQLAESLARYQAQAKDLQQALQEAERRLGDLRRKRSELAVRTRQATMADLAGVAADSETASSVSTFERWEQAVAADEYRSGAFVPVPDDAAMDAFAARFAGEEQQAARAAKLAALRKAANVGSQS